MSSPSQHRQQTRQIGRQRCLETNQPVVDWMRDRHALGVKRLPRKRNGPQLVGSEHVASFPDERVAVQARLKSNLIPLAGMQSHFDERGSFKSFYHAVLADCFL